MLLTPVLHSEALLAHDVYVCLKHPSGALPPNVTSSGSAGPERRAPAPAAARRHGSALLKNVHPVHRPGSQSALALLNLTSITSGGASLGLWTSFS